MNLGTLDFCYDLTCINISNSTPNSHNIMTTGLRCSTVVSTVASQQGPGFDSRAGRCLSVWSVHVLPFCTRTFHVDSQLPYNQLPTLASYPHSICKVNGYNIPSLQPNFWTN